MGEAFWAALCAAGALGFAGQAAATVVTVHSTGGYDYVVGPADELPVYLCGFCSTPSPGQRAIAASYNLGSWNADFTFDTDLGVPTDLAGSDSLRACNR